MNTLSRPPLPARAGQRYFAFSTLWVCLLRLCLGLAAAGHADAEAVIYPALPAEVLSQDYEVWGDGQPVEVCRARVLDLPFSKWGRDYGGPYLC